MERWFLYIYWVLINRFYESVIFDIIKNIIIKFFILIFFYEFKCLSFYLLIFFLKILLIGVMLFVLFFGIFLCFFNSVLKMFNIVDLGVSLILKNVRFLLLILW